MLLNLYQISTRLSKQEEERKKVNQNDEADNQKIRKQVIKNRDYERDLNRANQELVNAQSEIKKQEEELKSVKKSYREKLSYLLSVQEEFSSVKLSKNDDVNNESYVSQKEREEEKDPLTDLLISYNNSEEKMLKTLSNSNSQVRQLRENVRCLSDRYRACLDVLTEEGEMQGLISQRNIFKFDMILYNVTNNLIPFFCPLLSALKKDISCNCHFK